MPPSRAPSSARDPGERVQVCASLPRLSDGHAAIDRGGTRGPGSVSTAG